MPASTPEAGLLARWRDETGDATALGAVRVALGVLLLLDALRAARELEVGYFADVFHWPLLPESLVPSRAVYAALVFARVVLAVLVAVGVRVALLGSALLGTYVLLCDRLQFHNNRWALLCYAALLAFAPCDRSFRLRARPGSRVGPLWAARLAQLQVSLVYLASGGSKLLDPDWRGGRVLLERFHLYGSQALDAGVPGALVAWLSRADVTSALAKLAIATELLLAVGLWSRRTRVFALWWGVWFHLVIEATSRVESFTWLTLAVYILFVTPDVGARKVLFDPARATSRRAARAVTLLDWLRRFEVSPRTPEVLTEGRLVVVDRDGTPATGLRAVTLVARCVPLLFPLWAPLALVVRSMRRQTR